MTRNAFWTQLLFKCAGYNLTCCHVCHLVRHKGQSQTSFISMSCSPHVLMKTRKNKFWIFTNFLTKKTPIKNKKQDLLKCSWKGIRFFGKTCDEQLTRLRVFQFVWLYWTVCWEYEDKKYHTVNFHAIRNCLLGIRNSLALGRFSVRICYIQCLPSKTNI